MFLTYDITSRDSFENVGEWLNQAQINAGGKNVKYYLVGTKRDLKAQRQVQFEDAVSFAYNHNIHKVFETSAKDDFKCKPLFFCAANDIVVPNTEPKNYNNGASHLDDKDIWVDPNLLVEK